MAKKMAVPHLKQRRDGTWDLVDPASPAPRKRRPRVALAAVSAALRSVAALAFVVLHHDALGGAPSVRGRPLVATCDEYQAIETGMTLSQVQDVIGGPARSTMSMEFRTDGFADYSWSGEEQLSSVHVSLDRAGQVETKSQFDVCP